MTASKAKSDGKAHKIAAPVEAISHSRIPSVRNQSDPRVTYLITPELDVTTTVIQRADYPVLPPKTLRITGNKYFFKGKIVVWNGTKLVCEHGRHKS